MRMTVYSLIFVFSLLFAGCSDTPQPEASAKTENTINATVNQSSEKSSDTSSDDELLKYIKERDAEAAENWKKAMKTDKLENRERESGVF
ncbi:hypothetical protein LJC71_01845 [Desulfosarcina sp. OttesenSCG-928-A07]|nr:hypothetical protein [Desulfosarcina sp. OttesenSCG-928-G17]MDL2328480.1 hypothetical protein [Desulfosarcina sp. OttesenSCG-928-A07]